MITKKIKLTARGAWQAAKNLEKHGELVENCFPGFDTWAEMQARLLELPPDQEIEFVGDDK